MVKNKTSKVKLFITFSIFNDINYFFILFCTFLRMCDHQSKRKGKLFHKHKGIKYYRMSH